MSTMTLTFEATCFNIVVRTKKCKGPIGDVGEASNCISATSGLLEMIQSFLSMMGLGRIAWQQCKNNEQWPFVKI